MPEIVQIFWMILAYIAVVGVLVILSGFSVGLLVWKTRRDSHERLLGAKRAQSGPIHKDVLPKSEKKERDGAFDIIDQWSRKFEAAHSKDRLKGDE